LRRALADAVCWTPRGRRKAASCFVSIQLRERTRETPMHTPASFCCRKPKFGTTRHNNPAAGNCPRLLFGVGVGLLAMWFVVGAKPAGAQSADAEARCTGDVMRLCSEFVPDADSIVVCLKAKRLQLEPSCLNALSPVPPESLALPAPAKKKVRKAGGAPLSIVPTRSVNVRHRTTAAR